MIPEPYNPISLDRYAYSRNNPINYNDPSGHIAIPTYTTDQCGPDGLDCGQIPQDTYNSLIQWDPEYGSHINSTVKQGAEQAYIHAIRDPGYFQNLYFSNSWGNWESNNLDLYLQYSGSRTNAEAFLFQDKDIYAARIARGYIILGDETKAQEYLQTTLLSSAGASALSLPFKDSALANQIQNVVNCIDSTGCPPPGVRQGASGIYQNWNNYLPKPQVNWIESDVFPGPGPRGVLRIVMEPNGKVYFTNNHYMPGSFVQLR